MLTRKLLLSLGAVLAVPLLSSCVSLLPVQPVVEVGVDAPLGVAPFTVSFRSTVTLPSPEEDEGVWTFHWDFGDGTTAEGADVMHTYHRPGVYQAQVTISDGDDFTTQRSLTMQALAGTAYEVSRYTTGLTPVAVASLDLNLDKQLDVISANSKNHTISVFIAKGDALSNSYYQYPAIKSPSPNPQPQHITLGEFNRDGLTDLVVLNPPDDNLTILFGDGIGGFQTPSGYKVIKPLQALVGDFDGDGNNDVMVLSRRGMVYEIVKFKGKGTGELKLGNKVFHHEAITDMVKGDFDRDGDLDLIVATSGFGLEYIVLLNEGDRFLPPQYGLLDSKPLRMVTLDFDFDGLLDLVTANANGTLSLIKNVGGGQFEPTGVVPLNYNAVAALSASDLNGDHITDLLLQHDRGLDILLGDGKGRFTAPLPVEGFEGAVSPLGADINGDGLADLVMVLPDHNELLLGIARLTTQPAP